MKGVLSDPADDGVVYVFRSSNACSGALIAPNLVLTALHCLTDPTPEDAFTCDDGTLVSGDGELGAPVAPDQVGIRTGVEITTDVAAKGMQIFSTGSKVICRQDLALILLDRDIDAPLLPIRLGRRTTPGERARVIGYGLTTNTMNEGGRRVRDNALVLAVGEDGTNPATGMAAPYSIVIGEGPCRGDSGGPLLAEDTNAVMGVYSLLLSNVCQGSGIKNAYTQVAPFEGLILDAFEAAGHEPILEPPEAGGGSAGSGGAGGTGGTPAEGGEGGVPVEEGGASSGGSSGSGGSGASGGSEAATGGSDATGGTSATGGTGGAAASGGTEDGSGGTSKGTGSRRDPACTCRSAGAEKAPWSVVGWLLAGFACVARRRRRF